MAPLRNPSFTDIMSHSSVRVGVACILSAVLVGCMSSTTDPMVPRAHVGVAAELTQGRVISAVPVTIEGDNSGIGTMGGAGVGGAGGVAAAGGGGTEAIMASAVGAVAGAVVGKVVEERVTRKPGQRVTIRLDDGKIIEVVQEAEEGIFLEGDRVNVAVGDGVTRVSMAIGTDTREEIREPAWYEADRPAQISSQY
jgi:outer membrane lipoprotein SlyB